MLSSFLLENYLYFDVHEIISFQKLVGNLDKMILPLFHNKTMVSA
jgi:hypothetical protein